MNYLKNQLKLKKDCVNFVMKECLRQEHTQRENYCLICQEFKNHIAHVSEKLNY